MKHFALTLIFCSLLSLIGGTTMAALSYTEREKVTSFSRGESLTIEREPMVWRNDRYKVIARAGYYSAIAFFVLACIALNNCKDNVEPEPKTGDDNTNA